MRSFSEFDDTDTQPVIAGATHVPCSRIINTDGQRASYAQIHGQGGNTDGQHASCAQITWPRRYVTFLYFEKIGLGSTRNLFKSLMAKENGTRILFPYPKLNPPERRTTLLILEHN